MQTRLFLVLVVGLPLKLHSSQGLFFPKTANFMLRERFLIAKNTCENFFPRFARTDQRFAPLPTRRALSGHRLPQCATIVSRTTSFMPLPPLTMYTKLALHTELLLILLHAHVGCQAKSGPGKNRSGGPKFATKNGPPGPVFSAKSSPILQKMVLL